MTPSTGTVRPPRRAPTRPPRHPNDPALGAGMRLSVFIHLGIALVVLLKTVVFPSKPLPYVPARRVDLVGLPDMLKKDKAQLLKPPSDSMLEALKQAEKEARRVKEIKKAPKAAEPPAEKDELVLKPKAVGETDTRDQKLKSALARIKALNKIKSSIEENIERPQAASPQIKGNTVSKGTSLDGDAREAAEASYYDLLRERLQENWALPVWIARQNYSAQVQIYIDPRGNLKSFRFTKPSGNAQFDDAVKRTLSESSPFPKPPEGIADTVGDGGVMIGFPL